MTRVFIILTLLTIFSNVSGQKKKFRVPIRFYYSSLNSGGDTVKCKRTLHSELKSLQTTKGLDFVVAMRITTRIINIESMLDDKRQGVEGYEKSFAGTIMDLNTILDENRLELDLTEYINEFAFFQKHPVKSKEKLLKEAQEKARLEEETRQQERRAKEEKERERRRRLNDSLSIVAKRQQEINDSIEEVNYKIEQQRQRQQYLANQKKLEEQRKKEKEEYEIKQKARRQSLITKYGSENGELIFNRKVKIGWTKEMCIESWGKPRDVNRTTTANGTNEQWVYSLKKYLYFDNNILTAIQD